MLDQIARNWWAPVVRGIVAIIFGIVAFTMPGITLGSLVLLFGAYALVDGIFALASGVFNRTAHEDPARAQPRWLLILEGIIGIAAGLYTFAYPGITTVALLYIIGSWAVITGVVEIVAAVRLRHEIENEWLLGLSGVLSVLFGIALFARPAAGALAVVWMIGAYAVIFGGLLVGLGFRLRALAPHGTHVDKSGFAYQ